MLKLAHLVVGKGPLQAQTLVPTAKPFTDFLGLCQNDRHRFWMNRFYQPVRFRRQKCEQIKLTLGALPSGFAINMNSTQIYPSLAAIPHDHNEASGKPGSLELH